MLVVVVVVVVVVRVLVVVVLKVHPMTRLHRTREAAEVQIQLILNPALGAGWSSPQAAFTPGKKRYRLCRGLSGLRGR